MCLRSASSEEPAAFMESSCCTVGPEHGKFQRNLSCRSRGLHLIQKRCADALVPELWMKCDVLQVDPMRFMPDLKVPYGATVQANNPAAPVQGLLDARR